jgi:hypothetical protein
VGHDALMQESHRARRGAPGELGPQSEFWIGNCLAVEGCVRRVLMRRPSENNLPVSAKAAKYCPSSRGSK